MIKLACDQISDKEACLSDAFSSHSTLNNNLSDDPTNFAVFCGGSLNMFDYIDEHISND